MSTFTRRCLLRSFSTKSELTSNFLQPSFLLQQQPKQQLQQKQRQQSALRLAIKPLTKRLASKPYARPPTGKLLKSKRPSPVGCAVTPRTLPLAPVPNPPPVPIPLASELADVVSSPAGVLRLVMSPPSSQESLSCEFTAVAPSPAASIGVETYSEPDIEAAPIKPLKSCLKYKGYDFNTNLSLISVGTKRKFGQDEGNDQQKENEDGLTLQKPSKRACLVLTPEEELQAANQRYENVCLRLCCRGNFGGHKKTVVFKDLTVPEEITGQGCSVALARSRPAVKDSEDIGVDCRSLLPVHPVGYVLLKHFVRLHLLKVSSLKIFDRPLSMMSEEKLGSVTRFLTAANKSFGFNHGLGCTHRPKTWIMSRRRKIKMKRIKKIELNQDFKTRLDRWSTSHALKQVQGHP